MRLFRARNASHKDNVRAWGNHVMCSSCKLFLMRKHSIRRVHFWRPHVTVSKKNRFVPFCKCETGCIDMHACELATHLLLQLVLNTASSSRLSLPSGSLQPPCCRQGVKRFAKPQAHCRRSTKAQFLAGTCALSRPSHGPRGHCRRRPDGRLGRRAALRLPTKRGGKPSR